MTRSYKLGLLVLFVAGCDTIYQSRCPVGIYPFDGQTAVPVEQEIIFNLFLSEDQPHKYDNLRVWEQETGAEIDGDVRFDISGYASQLIFTPKQPLKPDTEYQAEGVTLNASRHYPNLRYRQGREAPHSNVSFSTASRPTVLGVYQSGSSYSDEPSVLSLIFSEPVNEEDASSLVITSEYDEDLFFEFEEVDVEKPNMVHYRTNFQSLYYDDSFSVSGERLRSREGDGEQGPFLEYVTFVRDASLFEYIAGGSCYPYPLYY